MGFKIQIFRSNLGIPWYFMIFCMKKDLMVVFGRYPPQFISLKSPAARQNDMWFHKRINSLVL